VRTVFFLGKLGSKKNVPLLPRWWKQGDVLFASRWEMLKTFVFLGSMLNKKVWCNPGGSHQLRLRSVALNLKRMVKAIA